MPKVKTTQPIPDKHKGQRSPLPLYFQRVLPPWQHPTWLEAEFWRRVVLNQPFAVICRETLIANILALDWRIEPRDSSLRDEFKGEIDYYTRFFEYTGDYSYNEIIEWVGTDLLDLPFGSGVELGYMHDDPSERLVWIELLDGATLFPTNNSKWPVGQVLKQDPTRQVFFPKHAINRVYMSPRPNIDRKGWGMAPPEKIYLALELLRRGDAYYANLLLDTPEVGILDLMDMEKSAAEEWVESWRNLLYGIDAFKIPVLYEHTTKAEFIQFNRSPSEMLFDRTTLRYGAICCAGYGMSLSDIGVQAVSKSGETLAGSIRQERRTRRTGLARLKRYFTQFFNRMLPRTLRFVFVDVDDELSTALGRARLAASTAFGQLISLGILTQDEARQQLIADGLITISIPEHVEDAQGTVLVDSKHPPERPSLLGRPVAPSSGGRGEVLQSYLDSIFDSNNPYLSVFLDIVSKVDRNVSRSVDDITIDENNFWFEIYQDIPELFFYDLDQRVNAIADLIDWCELPKDQIIDDLLINFSSLIKNNTVLSTKFRYGMENILDDFEAAIRQKIAELGVLYNSYVILGEEPPDLQSALQVIRSWSSEMLSLLISNFVKKLIGEEL